MVESRIGIDLVRVSVAALTDWVLRRIDVAARVGLRASSQVNDLLVQVLLVQWQVWSELKSGILDHICVVGSPAVWKNELVIHVALLAAYLLVLGHRLVEIVEGLFEDIFAGVLVDVVGLLLQFRLVVRHLLFVESIHRL